MLGGLTAAGLFTLGLHLRPEPSWAGLPFYASSVTCAILLILSLQLRQKRN
ncbi:MAG: hypothetical protein LQ342_007873 [Letrouitia transgressa]|nr:MAG: hypothetical protein LQ342_007873 [Letrouitia transgressa]